MAPTKYYPGYSYSGWQASNPAKPLPAPQVDNDFANISRSINEIIDAGVGGGGPGPGPGAVTTDNIENKSLLSGSMLTATLNGVGARLTAVENGSGGGGGATFYYASREAAAAASPGSAALLMAVRHLFT